MALGVVGEEDFLQCDGGPFDDFLKDRDAGFLNPTSYQCHGISNRNKVFLLRLLAQIFLQPRSSIFLGDFSLRNLVSNSMIA